MKTKEGAQQIEKLIKIKKLFLVKLFLKKLIKKLIKKKYLRIWSAVLVIFIY